MPATILIAAIAYLAGSVLATWLFARTQGPVPVPGRARRDLRDGLLWPCWLVLYPMCWLLGLRRQSFERELADEWAGSG